MNSGPTPGSVEIRKCSPDDERCPSHVGGEEVGPCSCINVCDPHERVDTCGIDDRIEAPEFRRHRLHSGLDGGFIGHITSDGETCTPRIPDSGPQQFEAARGKRDPSALGGGGESDGAAHSRRRADDQEPVACERSGRLCHSGHFNPASRRRPGDVERIVAEQAWTSCRDPPRTQSLRRIPTGSGSSTSRDWD